MQLQSERDAMDAEMADSRDLIKDLQSRLDSATSVMNQLKVDLDSRVRERDEEIENLRSASRLIGGFYYFITHTHTRLTPFVRDYPGEPVPER